MDVQQNQGKQTSAHIDFHGASIIDQNGRERPITEDMIQRAFDDLIRAWEKTHPNS